jgi:hypothetical protein
MEKYARMCDITNKGMNKGFCVQDGLLYIKEDEDMIKHLREVFTSFTDEYGDEIKASDLDDDELMEMAYEEDYYYYTEWDELD